MRRRALHLEAEISCWGDHIEEAPSELNKATRRVAQKRGGPPLNARTIMKLLGNRRVRQGTIKLLKNPTVRRVVISQIKRRLGRR